MKFIHLSDLHLGKRLHEFSLLEDQRYVLESVLEAVRRENPDAVLIAGDIYDKTVPSGEAVTLFDRFLTELKSLEVPVCVISGNHDSAERMAFGSGIMNDSGIYIAPVYDGTAAKVTLRDGYGPVNVFLLPFIKPASVRNLFPDAEINSYTDAVNAAIGAMDIDPAERNVLVAHQFVTGARTSESEEFSVGGLDNIDASVFAPFDYVALGHLHSPQTLAGGRIRYCGTPLKYSFSEAEDTKSLTVAELGADRELTIRELPLAPLHELKEIRGTYDELMALSFYENTGYRDDYMHITLTDEDDIPDAAARLRTVYRNLMKLDLDNSRTRAGLLPDASGSSRDKSPFELFSEFFENMNGRALSGPQQKILRTVIEKAQEAEL